MARTAQVGALRRWGRRLSLSGERPCEFRALCGRCRPVLAMRPWQGSGAWRLSDFKSSMHDSTSNGCALWPIVGEEEGALFLAANCYMEDSPFQTFVHKVEISCKESTTVCYLIKAGTRSWWLFLGTVVTKATDRWPRIMTSLVFGLDLRGRQIDITGQGRSANRLEMKCSRDRLRCPPRALARLRASACLQSTRNMQPDEKLASPAAAELHWSATAAAIAT